VTSFIGIVEGSCVAADWIGGRQRPPSGYKMPMAVALFLGVDLAFDPPRSYLSQTRSLIWLSRSPGAG
jgi:hypothetical protein